MRSTYVGLFIRATLLVEALFLAEIQAFAGGDSASTSANATQTVIKSISITKSSDLSFGEAAQGTGSLAISAASGSAASFAVSGEPNHAFSITLPADSTVTMITDDGTANKTIAVNSFVHNAGGSPVLDGSGSYTLKVGATRAAIGSSQVTGSYTGSFSVTVAYP